MFLRMHRIGNESGAWNRCYTIYDFNTAKAAIDNALLASERARARLREKELFLFGSSSHTDECICFYYDPYMFSHALMWVKLDLFTNRFRLMFHICGSVRFTLSRWYFKINKFIIYSVLFYMKSAHIPISNIPTVAKSIKIVYLAMIPQFVCCSVTLPTLETKQYSKYLLIFLFSPFVLSVLENRNCR